MRARIVDFEEKDKSRLVGKSTPKLSSGKPIFRKISTSLEFEESALPKSKADAASPRGNR